MSSTVRKCFLVLLIMAGLLPRLCLLQVTIVIHRNAFLFDNAQLISSDFRVLKSHTVYILLLFCEALFALECCTTNTFMNFPVNYTAYYSKICLFLTNLWTFFFPNRLVCSAINYSAHKMCCSSFIEKNTWHRTLMYES